MSGRYGRFWVEAKNVGDSARYVWYNDIFHLPEENPRNELLSYAETKLTMVMGQEDTWMKVFVTPSNEVCTERFGIYRYGIFEERTVGYTKFAYYQ